MNSRRVVKFLQLIIISTAIAIISCSSPLMDIVKEEVEVVTTPPQVLSIFPESGAEEIPISTNTISVTLSKSIDKGSVTSSTFYLTDSNDNKVTGVISVDNDTLSFTPNAVLSVGTVYTVTINGIKDTDGNTITEEYEWSFTTGIEGDVVIPVISSITINDGDTWTNDTNVEVFVDATDNFGISQMNISLTGSFADAGWITYSDTFNLELTAVDGAKIIYIKLKDGSGNISDGSVTAGINLDTVKPNITLFNLDGGNSGTRNSTVSIDIFADDGNEGSGVDSYRLHTEGGEWSDWNPLTGGSVSLTDQALTVSSNETEVFYVQVQDNAGNESEISAESITMDMTAPSVDSSLSSPLPGSSGNSVSSYIKVVFDGEMDTGTISSSTVYITKGTTQISTDQYNFVDNKTAIEFTEFELSNNPYTLEQNTDYTILINSSVTDVAGNAFGSDYSYSFSNGSFLDETAPEGSIVLNLDSPDINATASSTFDLEINASDDYNGVRAVKIWGDNIGAGYATFESEASWELYIPASTTGGGVDYMSYNTAYAADWSLIANDGNHYIYYKFMDYSNNESATPGILKVSLDTTNPDLNGIQIDSGTGYSNNENGTVNIILDAEDLQSGLNEMWISFEANNTNNPPASESGSWIEWSSLTSSYSISTDEGKYYIYGEVKDYVNRPSGVEGNTFILDYTDPVVTFTGDDILEVNRATEQTVTITDKHPADDGVAPSPLNYEIPSGIETYQWEQLSGPGTIIFSDSAIVNPVIGASASDGSEDGNYEIKVTATDKAGNSSYSITDFVWDTVNPGDIGLISAFHADGTALTTSANGSMVYTSSAQPFATWTATTGADFYTILPSNAETDPNNSGSPEYWDDPSLDWNDSGTYDGDFVRNDNPIVSAPAPDNPGQNDGVVYLYVAAWDNADNRSNNDSHKFVKFWIDTLTPVVTNLQALPPSNSALSLDYRNSDNGGDGRVYDQKTADDPTPGTEGSGIESYLWEQSSGSGTLTIQNATTLTPTVSAAPDGSEDDQYELQLTVTDKAGNIGTGYTGFVWDTTAPVTPDINGIAHTPNLEPTWSWSGQGGGNGYYRYRLERFQVDVSGNQTGSVEEISLAGSDVSAPYWVTDSTDLSYQHICSHSYKYTLYIEERDSAGNWSSSNNHEIWTDTNYTSEPTITRDGAYLRNAGNREVTWDWTTGLGGTGDEYRYRLLDSYSTVIVDYWDDHYSTNTLTIDFETYSGGLPDDEYTLEVEEYNTSGGGSWVGKVASSIVEIDATAPNAPTFTYNTGADTPTDYKLTKDTTPYFRWTGGGGGIGSYRWSFDESSWTYTNSYYVTTSNSEGDYIFYVQERDTAGNWSDSAEYKLEIDTTAPTLNSILLNNRSLNAWNTTSYTVGTSVNIDVNGSGTNAQTYASGDIRYMKFWNEGGSKYNTNYNTSFSGWPFNWGGGSTADGSKYVYCELEDYAGNISVSRYDSITLDTVAPVISSFSINGGDTTSTSSSVTLNSTLPADSYAMRMSTDGGSTWSGWYGDSPSISWVLSTANGYNGYGAKKVMVQFTDIAGYYCRNNSTQLAGHDTDVQDSIFYGSPVIKYASKGQYTTGAIYTNYESFEDSGDSANTYHIYYATSPTGYKYEKGTTTHDSQYYNSTYTKGTLYYFFVRVYNPDIGYSNFSEYTPGFSSNVTIVYNDGDSTDSSTASTIKNVLLTNLPSYSTITGTMPTWTVTILPQSLVESSYGTGENIIYGDPVIVTPQSNLYTDSGKVRNIGSGGRGVIAMSFYGGLKFLETVDNNWGTWGFTGQRPDEISYGNPYNYVTNKTFMYTWRSGNSVWTSPLTSTLISTATNEDLTQIGATGLNERGLHRPGRDNPTGGYLYGRSQNYTDRFPVVRQGRFLYYGYDGMWNRTSGYVYFANLVARMDNF